MASVIRGNDNFDSSSVGPSTTLGDVGTYVIAGGGNGTAYNAGSTASGSTLRKFPTYNNFTSKLAHNQTTDFGLSGTWRYMMNDSLPGTNYSAIGLWVRIS